MGLVSSVEGSRVASGNALGWSPSRLSLGTVQLGMPYGVANRSGMPDAATAEQILDAAFLGGITTLDTAAAYGESEARIGRWRLRHRTHAATRVVTKLPAAPAEDALVSDFVTKAIQRSSRQLAMDRLDLVLTHRGEDLLRPVVADALSAAVDRGSIAGYGASVYDPALALAMLDRVPISALQVPVSVVDRRFVDSGVLDRARERDAILFARSTLLQGALAMTPASLPAHLAMLAPVIAALQALASSLRLTPAQVALRAVTDLPGVTSVVVGVEGTDQLAAHLDALAAPAIPEHLLAPIAAAAAGLPAAVVNPAFWPHDSG